MYVNQWLNKTLKAMLDGVLAISNRHFYDTLKYSLFMHLFMPEIQIKRHHTLVSDLHT
jgi:hypothetical protein